MIPDHDDAFMDDISAKAAAARPGTITARDGLTLDAVGLIASYLPQRERRDGNIDVAIRLRNHAQRLGVERDPDQTQRVDLGVDAHARLRFLKMPPCTVSIFFRASALNGLRSMTALSASIGLR